MYIMSKKQIKLAHIGMIYNIMPDRVYGVDEVEGLKAIKQGAWETDAKGEPLKKAAKKRGRPRKTS